jgi:ADP-heptose:LPS heptosyltransferase
MYRIAIGETPSEYFYRSFGVTFRSLGFADDPETDDRVEIRLTHRHGFDLKRDRLVFIQGRCRGEKNYDHMDELGQVLVERGHKVVMIGGLVDSRLVDRPGVLANLCGMPVWQTLRALRHAALVITPDSAFMHAAGALAKPALALFGPTPSLWAEPYANTTAVVFTTLCAYLPCWVGAKDRPPCGAVHHRPCLNDIPAHDIADLAERKLAGRLDERLFEVPLMPARQIV